MAHFKDGALVTLNTYKKIIITDDTICLKKSDYEIILKDTSWVLKLKILDKKILDRINKTKSPIFNICIEGKSFIAKGNGLLSSSLPKECNYYYHLVESEKVLIVDSTISFYIVHGRDIKEN